MNENREYKSDVFSMLMEDKRYALEVYNALNGSDYTDPGACAGGVFPKQKG